MNTLLLFTIAILPVVLILKYIHGKDKNKEPISLLVKLFFAGVASCFLVLLISMVLEPIFPFMQIDLSSPETSFLDVFLYSFIGVALIEEFCKFSMTYVLGYRHKAFDEAFDIVVYSIFVAIGFAGFENILYVLPNGIGTGISRGLLAVPGHACDGLFMGCYLSLAKLAAVRKDKIEERDNIIKSIAIPTVLHGIYDFCCFIGSDLFFIVFIIFVITMYIIAIKKINYLSKNNKLLHEKAKPIVSVEEKNIDTKTVTDNSNINNDSKSTVDEQNYYNRTPRSNDKSDYFTMPPVQPIPSVSSKSENFKFEASGVPYIPETLQAGAASYLKEPFVHEEVPITQETIIEPIPELPLENLDQEKFCVYCGAKVEGEYCSICGHKTKE